MSVIPLACGSVTKCRGNKCPAFVILLIATERAHASEMEGVTAHNTGRAAYLRDFVCECIAHHVIATCPSA